MNDTSTIDHTLNSNPLAVIQGQGIYTNKDGTYVLFTADADIDFDGANGQSGGRAAYMINDAGIEYLANGGMGMSGSRVKFTQSWGVDIVFLDGLNPLVIAGGVIPSKTSYKYPGKENTPEGQVDADTVPYIVVPPQIIRGVPGAVLGCKARIGWHGNHIDAVVADVGPRAKIGEISVAAARALGMQYSRKGGGEDKFSVEYELWPGTPAPGFVLQRANGTHIL